MKMTLSELRATLKSLKSDLESKKNELRLNCFKITHRTSEGLVESLNEAYDFNENLNKYESLYRKYINYNILLQDINSKHILTDGSSLSETITKAKQIRLFMNEIDELSKKKGSKKRIEGYNNSYYYETKDLNFDISSIVEKRDKLRDTLKKLDSIIDRANNEIIVDIEE